MFYLESKYNTNPDTGRQYTWREYQDRYAIKTDVPDLSFAEWQKENNLATIETSKIKKYIPALLIAAGAVAFVLVIGMALKGKSKK